MARRTTKAAETADDATPRAPVRRRRRRTTVDYAAQTAILVNALLDSRGEEGAPQEALVAVCEWSRGVHEEDAAIRQLKNRPRLLKAEVSTERLARYEVNKALLDGVLGGTIGINVDEDGGLVFTAKG